MNQLMLRHNSSIITETKALIITRAICQSCLTVFCLHSVERDTLRFLCALAAVSMESQ